MEEFKQKWVFIIINLVLVISLVATYFYFFPTIKREVEAASEQLAFEKRMLQSVEENASMPQEEEEVFDMKEFQRLVPVQPLVDQFIFDLEKAEVFSDSFITTYTFTTDSFSGTDLEMPIEEDNGENEQTEEADNTPQTNDAPISDAVERVTVNLSVMSPDYDSLVEFLHRIERIDRITKIDNISFGGRPTVEKYRDIEENDGSLEYTIQISTFYLPELTQYIEDLPVIIYPSPSKKENPFTLKEEKDENE